MMLSPVVQSMAFGREPVGVAVAGEGVVVARGAVVVAGAGVGRYGTVVRQPVVGGGVAVGAVTVAGSPLGSAAGSSARAEPPWAADAAGIAEVVLVKGAGSWALRLDVEATGSVPLLGSSRTAAGSVSLLSDQGAAMSNNTAASKNNSSTPPSTYHRPRSRSWLSGLAVGAVGVGERRRPGARAEGSVSSEASTSVSSCSPLRDHGLDASSPPCADSAESAVGAEAGAARPADACVGKPLPLARGSGLPTDAAGGGLSALGGGGCFGPGSACAEPLEEAGRGGGGAGENGRTSAPGDGYGVVLLDATRGTSGAPLGGLKGRTSPTLGLATTPGALLEGRRPRSVLRTFTLSRSKVICRDLGGSSALRGALWLARPAPSSRSVSLPSPKTPVGSAPDVERGWLSS